MTEPTTVTTPTMDEKMRKLYLLVLTAAVIALVLDILGQIKHMRAGQPFRFTILVPVALVLLGIGGLTRAARPELYRVLTWAAMLLAVAGLAATILNR